MKYIFNTFIYYIYIEHCHVLLTIVLYSILLLTVYISLPCIIVLYTIFIMFYVWKYFLVFF